MHLKGDCVDQATIVGQKVMRAAMQIAEEGNGREVIEFGITSASHGKRRVQVEVTIPPRIQPKPGGSDA